MEQLLFDKPDLRLLTNDYELWSEFENMVDESSHTLNGLEPLGQYGDIESCVPTKSYHFK